MERSLANFHRSPSFDRSPSFATLGLGLGRGKDIDLEPARLQRNVLFVNDDEAWNSFLATSNSLCSCFVLFRKNRCPTCAHIAPKAWEASCDSQGMTEVAFVDVDVDGCPSTEVHFAPSYRIYSHGRLKGTFTGVSVSGLKDHIHQMYMIAESCKPCGNKVTLAASELTSVILSSVMGKLRCPRDCGEVYKMTYNQLPLGLSRVHFDFDLKLHQSPQSRARELHRRLSESPCSADPGHECIFAFLRDVRDDNLEVSEVWSTAHRWLTEKYGHASLWPEEQNLVRQRLVNAALARRATRVELWLLLSLDAIKAPSKMLAKLAKELRAELATELQGLRNHGRACMARCSQCGLMCSAGPHGHSGPHDCLTDHRCHHTLCAGAHGSCPCLREAGHINSCLFQQPSLPLGVPRRTILSRADVFAPLTALIPLEAPQPRTALDLAPCPICLDSLGSGGACVALPCGHCFHRICTVEWLVRKPFCPLCRLRVVGTGTGATSLPLTLFAFSKERNSSRLPISNIPNGQTDQSIDLPDLQVQGGSSDEDPSAHAVGEQLGNSSHDVVFQSGSGLHSTADGSSNVMFQSGSRMDSTADASGNVDEATELDDLFQSCSRLSSTADASSNVDEAAELDGLFQSGSRMNSTADASSNSDDTAVLDDRIEAVESTVEVAAARTGGSQSVTTKTRGVSRLQSAPTKRSTGSNADAGTANNKRGLARLQSAPSNRRASAGSAAEAVTANPGGLSRLQSARPNRTDSDGGTAEAAASPGGLSRLQSARSRACSSTTTSLGFRPSAVAPRNSSFSRRRPPVL